MFFLRPILRGSVFNGTNNELGSVPTLTKVKTDGISSFDFIVSYEMNIIIFIILVMSHVMLCFMRDRASHVVCTRRLLALIWIHGRAPIATQWIQSAQMWRAQSAPKCVLLLLLIIHCLDYDDRPGNGLSKYTLARFKILSSLLCCFILFLLSTGKTRESHCHCCS